MILGAKISDPCIILLNNIYLTGPHCCQCRLMTLRRHACTASAVDRQRCFRQPRLCSKHIGYHTDIRTKSDKFNCFRVQLCQILHQLSAAKGRLFISIRTFCKLRDLVCKLPSPGSTDTMLHRKITSLLRLRIILAMRIVCIQDHIITNYNISLLLQQYRLH